MKPNDCVDCNQPAHELYLPRCEDCWADWTWRFHGRCQRVAVEGWWPRVSTVKECDLPIYYYGDIFFEGDPEFAHLMEED